MIEVVDDSRMKIVEAELERQKKNSNVWTTKKKVCFNWKPGEKFLWANSCLD